MALLKAHKYDLNYRSQKGDYLILFATVNRVPYGIFRYLVQEGAKLEVRNPDGNSVVGLLHLHSGTNNQSTKMLLVLGKIDFRFCTWREIEMLGILNVKRQLVKDLGTFMFTFQRRGQSDGDFKRLGNFVGREIAKYL